MEVILSTSRLKQLPLGCFFVLKSVQVLETVPTFADRGVSCSEHGESPRDGRPTTSQEIW
jgi:hypothetical protein